MRNKLQRNINSHLIEEWSKYIDIINSTSELSYKEVLTLLKEESENSKIESNKGAGNLQLAEEKVNIAEKLSRMINAYINLMGRKVDCATYKLGVDAIKEIILDNIEILKKDIDTLLRNNQDIFDFFTLLNESKKTVELKLQNDNYLYTTNSLMIFDKKKEILEIAKECEKMQDIHVIDIDSIIVLFDSNDINDPYPYLITDKSGRIFKYKFGKVQSFEIDQIYDTIWDLFGGKQRLINKLSASDEKIYIENIKYLKDFVNIEKIMKFDIHGITVSDYHRQLWYSFKQSNGELILKGFDCKSNTELPDDEMECTITINDTIRKINLNKGKWYDFSFAKKINNILESIDSKYRLSFVHESYWDEIHGIKLSTIEEYEILKNNNLIVG